MNHRRSTRLASLSPSFAGPVTLSVIFAVSAACIVGCGGARPTTTTAPVTSTYEPRGATGQLLEDLFFLRVAGASRFDMDAALDEDGSYGEEQYYDEVAAGEYGDEAASGEDDEVVMQEVELLTAHAELTRLASELRAEEHALADPVGALQESIAGFLAESGESRHAMLLEEAEQSILPALLRAADSMVRESPPRPGNATDCSAGTIALYAAVYDTVVGVSAHAHVNLNAYVSEREQWAYEQAEPLAAASALIEWIENEPEMGDLEAVREHAMELGDALRDIDAYLTRGSEGAVDSALAGLNDAETESQLRDGLAALRVAVLATLANVPQPPYEPVIAAFAALPDRLDAILAQLPSPGPRAARRLHRHGEIARLSAAIDYPPEELDDVMAWVGVACEGAAPGR